MGANAKGLKPRKATFKVAGAGKTRVFTAVNKRAHTVCVKAGKRSKLSNDQLKAMVGKGTYKFYAVIGEGAERKLKPIRF